MAVIDTRSGNEGAQYLALAKLFSDIGYRQSQEQEREARRQATEAENKQRQIQQYIEMAIKAGDYATADQLAAGSGIPQIQNGGFEGMGQRLGDRAAQEAASAAEAERRKKEAESNEVMALIDQRSPRALGTMTDDTSGMPGIAAPRTNVWDTETGVSPQQQKILLLQKLGAKPEVLQALERLTMSEQQNATANEMNANLIQTADESADTAVANRNAKVGERNASVGERAESRMGRALDAELGGGPGGAAPDISGDQTIRAGTKDQAKALGDIKTGATFKGAQQYTSAANRLATSIDNIDKMSPPQMYTELMSVMQQADGSVFREGEYAAYLMSFGGAEGFKQKIAALSGESTPRAKQELKNIATNMYNKAKNDAAMMRSIDEAYAKEWGIQVPVSRLYGNVKVRELAGSKRTAVPADDLP